MRRPVVFALGAAALFGTAVGSTAAFGLPWDVDMVDSQAIKAYHRKMEPLPEGVVSQPNVISPKVFQPAYGIASPEAAALRNPLDNTPETLALGHQMFTIYCTPCHGDGTVLGPLAAPGYVPAVPQLAGPNGRLQMRSDGWVYMTIREGSLSKIMPAYGYTMTREEQWAVVAYVRTLDNGAYIPPAPPPEPGTPAPTGAPQ